MFLQLLWLKSRALELVPRKTLKKAKIDVFAIFAPKLHEERIVSRVQSNSIQIGTEVVTYSETISPREQRFCKKKVLSA